MRKILIAIAALAVAVGFASCIQEDVPETGGAENGLRKVTITASFKGVSKVTYSETDNVLTPAWEKNDGILVINYDNTASSLEVTEINGNVATLEGEAKDGTAHLIYKKGAGTSSWVDNRLTVSYDNQSGNNDMPAVMLADGKISKGNGKFAFQNAGAVIGIFNAKGVPAGSEITRVTVTGSNLSEAAISINDSKIALDATEKDNDFISTATLSNITVTDGTTGVLNDTIFIAVPAGAVVQKVSLTVGADAYSYTLASAKECKANNYLYIKTSEFEKDDSFIESVSLDWSAVTIFVDDTASLAATVLPANATDKSVNWSSNNAGVASVDANGKVAAVAVGTATITATTNEGGKTATCTVTVISKDSLPEGTLPGVFTVADPDGIPNSGDESKIHFSQGNLYYDGANWGFEEEQYYFRTYEGFGKYDVNGYGQYSGTASGHWGLFGWSTPATNYGMNISTDNNGYSGVFRDWGTAIDDEGSWETLPYVELKYLLDHHAYLQAKVDISGTSGLVIAPDGFNGDKNDLNNHVNNTYWKDRQAEGFVFLPDAGCRNGGNVTLEQDAGFITRYTNFYWTSTASGTDCAWFDEGVAGRSQGCSVRLITRKGSPAPSVVYVDSVRLDQTTATLFGGETVTLAATVFPENATNNSVSWSSSKPGVAYVDANGTVTAKAAGTATITVTTTSASTDGSFKTATCTVTVMPHVESVRLNMSGITPAVGFPVTLTATVLPEGAPDKSVSWSSSDTGVATVDATGKVTAVAAGTATITVTTTDGSKTATCAVTVTSVVALPEGALPGEFSVSDNKKVYFSKGNLWADASGDNASNPVLHFEPSQDAFSRSNESNHVSYFNWSSTVVKAVGTENEGDFLFCDEDHKQSVDNSESIYYALSQEEWKYLFNTPARMVYGKDCYSYSSSQTFIEGSMYYGAFVYPDNYNGEVVSDNSMTWEQINAAGIVFLPAAGYYSSSNNKFYNVNGGDYWYPSPWGSTNACKLHFADGALEAEDKTLRKIGCALRLVTGVGSSSVVSVESVSLDKTTATLAVGGTVTLAATVSPSDATNRSVSWSSSDTGVATVNANGKVTAIAAGEAIITVTTTHGGKIATCTVTVNDAGADTPSEGLNPYRNF